MTSKKRPYVKNTIVMELWAKAAGRCEFEGCNKDLWVDGLTARKINQSNISHIVAASPRGPRGDKELSRILVQDISNLMLTCLKHHKVIDDKKHVEYYTIDRLKEMKERHEQRIKTVTSIMPERKTTVITYFLPIANKPIHLSDNEILSTVLPDFYPEIDKIRLGKDTSFTEQHSNYWEIQKKELKEQFKKKIVWKMENGDIKHISVFALAQQSLLIYLGYLLGNKYPTNVFQLNKEKENWRWRSNDSDIRYIIKKPSMINKSHNPVLNISLSANIDKERIRSVLPENDIWTFTIDNPNDDFLVAKSQLTLFKHEIRKLLDEIKNTYGCNSSINVFSAMPVATSVEFGRLIQPKIDLPIIIYEHINNKIGFVAAIQIDEDEIC